MNLIGKIYEEMATDCDSDDNQAGILQDEYTATTVDQQKAIDRVFIALCGWSLKTLIGGHEVVTVWGCRRSSPADSVDTART